jgi:hypothetical protein
MNMRAGAALRCSSGSIKIDATPNGSGADSAKLTLSETTADMTVNGQYKLLICEQGVIAPLHRFSQLFSCFVLYFTKPIEGVDG